MVLPRPALIAILGGVLVLAVFLVTRAGGPAEDEAVPAPAPVAQTPAPAEPDAQPASAERERDGLPAAVERALAAKQVFVMLFTQQGSDDEATSAAVDQLDGVRVFKADIADIGDYRRVVAELGIDQAPAVVIVDGQGKARLVEGYVDAGSLTQQIEDSR